MNEHQTNSVVTNIDDFHIDYKAIYENFPDGVSIFDNEGCHLWCNKVALDLYGYSSVEEAKGKSFRDFIHPDYLPDEEEIFQRLKNDEVIPLRDASMLVFRKDGTTFTSHSRTTPLYSEGKFIGFQTHSRDISELKTAEYKLRTSLSELEILITLIRHDFGNDLQIVETALDTALLLMEGNTRPMNYLSIAKSGIHRMRSLLMLMVPSDIEEEDLLDDIIEQRIVEAQEIHPNLEIILKIQDSVSPILIGRRRLLAFVFDNLFRNSASYAGHSSTIVVNVEKHDEILQIDVVDDGPGISENLKEVLFLKGTTTSGSGIGLFISRRILESYGGSIDLLESSSLNTGAALRITLPLGSSL